MALAKRQSQNNRIIVIFVVVLIVGALGYFAYTRWLNGSDQNSNVNTPGSGGSTIQFDKKVLDDPRLKSLVPYRKTVNQNADGGQPYPFQ